MKITHNAFNFFRPCFVPVNFFQSIGCGMVGQATQCTKNNLKCDRMNTFTGYFPKNSGSYSIFTACNKGVVSVITNLIGLRRHALPVE